MNRRRKGAFAILLASLLGRRASSSWLRSGRLLVEGPRASCQVPCL